MVYKWCIVPQCTNTSIKSPNKLFVSVPKNPKRRKRWLKLAQRHPNSILSHTNVFMCEDHFDMEKDTMNYLKYKMGFSKYILLADEAVPTKFNCQKDHKNRLSDPGPSQKEFLKTQSINLVTQLLSHNPTTSSESLPKDDDMIQQIIEPEDMLFIELPKAQDKETVTDSIITMEKSVQVTIKLNEMHYMSKGVQTRCQNKNISTSPLIISTSCFTSPFNKKPCGKLQPSLSGVIKSLKRNIVFEDEKLDSGISNIGNTYS